MAARITSCIDLACFPVDASARRAVATVGESGSWLWRLSPKKPGFAHLIVSISTYNLNTSVVLNEEVVDIGLRVLATPAYRREEQIRQRQRQIGGIIRPIKIITGIIIGIAAASAAITGGLVSVRAGLK